MRQTSLMNVAVPGTESYRAAAAEAARITEEACQPPAWAAGMRRGGPPARRPAGAPARRPGRVPAATERRRTYSMDDRQ